MKNVIKFILFIFYTIFLFLIKDVKILVLAILLNFIVTFLLKFSLKNMFYSIKMFLPFIAFTILFNILFASLQEGILMGIRIMICYHTTYLFSQTITILQVADTIQKISAPLKLFKVNTKNIGIMISISICMLPILKKEMETLMQTMKAKGERLKPSNMAIIMKPMLISILKKTGQIEKTLLAKAYEE